MDKELNKRGALGTVGQKDGLEKFTQKKSDRGSSASTYLIPGAILVAGILVAGSIFMTADKKDTNPVGNPSPSAPTQPQEASAQNVRPVSDKDHVRGSADAPVKIVEFSDTECPFCKRHHSTMQRVMQEYGVDGRVAWVYRHFPLDSLHSKARIEASAVELAGKLGGNDKFWEYLDRLFEVTPSNDGLELNLLVQIAKDVGLPTEPFQKIVDENDRRGGEFAAHIEEDYRDALAAGGRGTPYSIVIAPNGSVYPIEGALPYDAIKSIIDLALQQK